MTETHKKSFWEELRNAFITGLLALIPIYITFWIVRLVFNLFDNIVPFVSNKMEGLGFLVSILFILVIGFSAKNIVAKKLLKYFEDLLGRVPFVKNIYMSSKHVITAISNSSKTSTFSKVVLVEYPRAGVYSIGFLTKEDNNSILSGGQPICAGMSSVFIPTVPNPTTGFFILLPKAEIKILDMSIEQGFKMIISAGIITPDAMTISNN